MLNIKIKVVPVIDGALGYLLACNWWDDEKETTHLGRLAVTWFSVIFTKYLEHRNENENSKNKNVSVLPILPRAEDILRGLHKIKKKTKAGRYIRFSEQFLLFSQARILATNENMRYKHTWKKRHGHQGILFQAYWLGAVCWNPEAWIKQFTTFRQADASMWINWAKFNVLCEWWVTRLMPMFVNM